MKAKPSKKKIFNEILSWIMLFASAALLIFACLRIHDAKETGEPVFLFGYRPVLVLTGSMEPYMMTNSVALTKQVDSMDDLEVGDVITFHVANEEGGQILITHRIIAIDGDEIYTKGDNNHVDDSFPLTIENVEAKVILVLNQTAWLAAKWQTTTGKVMILCFAAALVLAYVTIRMWISSARSNKAQQEEPEALEEMSESETPEAVSAEATEETFEKPGE